MIRVMPLSILIVSILFLVGCGGGSVGTGTGETRIFEGQVKTTDQAPVEGAKVTVEESGDSGTTDSGGRFSFESAIPVDVAIVNLRVDFAEISQTIPVDTSDLTVDGALSVDIEIDPRAQNITANKTKVVVKVVGNCDRYFENRRIIRQSNKLASGTVCTVKAQIVGDGKPLERVPFLVERAGCVGKVWNFVSAGETGFGVNAGVGQANFTFYDSDDFCQYRVTAPYGIEGLSEVIFSIHTFRKQHYDSRAFETKPD